MKKLVMLLLSMILVFCMCVPFSAKAEEGTNVYNGFSYEVWDGEGGEKEIYISGYTGTDAEVVVPAEIGGVPVKTVQFSFADGNSTMTTLKFSEGIEIIYPFTAEGASALKTVYIPSTVTGIYQDAFLYCDSLQNIIVDDKNEVYFDLDGVLYGQFQEYVNDQPVKDEKGNPVMNAICELYPRGRRDAEYILPSEANGASVVLIADRAFHGNQDLRSVVIPDSVEDIYFMAFGDCINLEKLTFLGKGTTPEYDDYENKYNDIVGLYINSDGADEMTVVYPEKLVMYVVKDSEMEKYAKAAKIPYKYIEENVATNKEFNVEIRGVKEGALAYGTQVVVKDVTASILEAAKTKLGDMKYRMFDITLSLDGKKVQPNGEVTVYLPIPEGYNPSKCNVYYVADDGNFTDMKAKAQEGFLLFTTNHFSNYVIVEGTVTTTSPKTGDSSQTMLWIAMLCVSVGLYGVYSKKRRSYN